MREAGTWRSSDRSSLFIGVHEFGERAAPAVGAIGGNDPEAGDPGALFDGQP
jgi:hypothetical protein